MNAILVALAVFGAADAAANPRQLRVQVVICEGDPLGSRAEGTIKYLAEPVVVTLNGRPAFFRAGSKCEVLIPADADGVRPVCSSGVEMEVLPVLRLDGKVLLSLSATRTKPAAGGRTATEHNVKLTRLTEQGKTFRHRIAADGPDAQTWVEVTVTAVKP